MGSRAESKPLAPDASQEQRTRGCSLPSLPPSDQLHRRNLLLWWGFSVSNTTLSSTLTHPAMGKHHCPDTAASRPARGFKPPLCGQRWRGLTPIPALMSLELSKPFRMDIFCS